MTRRQMIRQLQPIEGWEERVAQVIKDMTSKPHRYGRNDCFMMAVFCQKEKYGKSLWLRKKRRYRGPKGARALRAKYSRNNFMEVLDRMHQRITCDELQIGDFVVNGMRDDIPCIYLWDGSKFVTVVGHATHRAELPMEFTTIAWRL